MPDPTWTSVPLSRLHRPELVGRTMRVLSWVIGADRRQHLVLMAQGVYGGPVRDDERRLYVDVLPDPDAELVDDQQRDLARSIRVRRDAAVAAGEDPGRELWGPLTIRNVLQIEGTL